MMMKIAIVGAGGVRTPLIVQAILKRQASLGISELSLMDIDAEHLELIGALTIPIERSPMTKFQINRTTDARSALSGADYVITTFRVGGMAARVIDERVALQHGILGQETTGAGGFAMAMRSIPVILDYVHLMETLCPNAWLINFSNPAGMLTEAVIRNTSWRRVVGICDAPTAMHQVISAILDASTDEVHLDYFGLNHLGWIRRIVYRLQDKLPEIIQLINTVGSVPGLPFDSELVYSLGMIPNEYLYYYYSSVQAVNNILKRGESRGEQIYRENQKLFSNLKERHKSNDIEGMEQIYQSYLDERGSSYMVKETGKTHDLSVLGSKAIASLNGEGYAGVALNLIEGLTGSQPRMQILNIPNSGAIIGMNEQDVVELPCMVSKDFIQPMTVGEIPAHCLGLIKQVKQYETLTIAAAVEGSYQKARLALTVHPLVKDFDLAGIILDEYMARHKGYFPKLQ